MSRGEIMLLSKATFAGIPAVILMVAQADAQVTIDVSKISCDQYLTSGSPIRAA